MHGPPDGPPAPHDSPDHTPRAADRSVVPLYESEVLCRGDIDRMEEAIRNVRRTMSSPSDGLSSGIRRCNILETRAYMDMRLTLLRWIAEPLAEDSGRLIRCHIGSGISVRGFVPPDGVPRVQIVLKHSDNDGSLPVTDAEAPRYASRGGDDDEDEGPRSMPAPRAPAPRAPARAAGSGSKRKQGM